MRQFVRWSWNFLRIRMLLQVQFQNWFVAPLKGLPIKLQEYVLHSIKEWQPNTCIDTYWWALDCLIECIGTSHCTKSVVRFVMFSLCCRKALRSYYAELSIKNHCYTRYINYRKLVLAALVIGASSIASRQMHKEHLYILQVQFQNLVHGAIERLTNQITRVCAAFNQSRNDNQIRVLIPIDEH